VFGFCDAKDSHFFLCRLFPAGGMVFLPAPSCFFGETPIFRLQRNLSSIELTRASDPIEVRRAKKASSFRPTEKFMQIK
jgi:hypothetical protein